MILASDSWPAVTLAVAVCLGYAASAVAARRLRLSATRTNLILTWLLHGVLIGVGLWGPASRFGFAPALSMTAWLAMAIYAVESRVYPQLQTRPAFPLMGAIAVVLALLFPGQPLHAAASPWLPLHLALGVASYGLFAAAMAHAWLLSRAENRIRHAAESHSGVPLLTLERLTFRFVTAGFVLLTATLLAGFLFDESLYGTVWKWNHKTVFSVLSWLTFAVLLMGRMRFGWRGRRAARMLYAGSGLLLLAYVGSRFVLEIILARHT
ncbi:MAG: cytochrome c biogenesis protein CcsA [Hylemonella sp.]|nr:cytochrome c biogenesis protein CcsA [Hylemonella sp.]